MTDAAFTAAVMAAFQAFNERRFDDFAQSVTEDVEEVYPQSGERFIGRDTQLAMHRAFPNPPTFTVERIRRDGDLAVVETSEGYPDGSTWQTVFILELRGDQIARQTMYFGTSFQAPAWRRQFSSESRPD